MIRWLTNLFRPDLRRSAESIAKERDRLILARTEAVRAHRRWTHIDRRLRAATTALLRTEVGR
jgi:hypothetical protein